MKRRLVLQAARLLGGVMALSRPTLRWFMRRGHFWAAETSLLLARWLLALVTHYVESDPEAVR